MPHPVLLTMFHVMFDAPAPLNQEQLARVRRTLRSRRLRQRLEDAVREAVARFPSLDHVRVRLTD